MSESRVLVVDDEPAIHRFLKSALIVNGYTVLQATSGQQAIALARVERPDLIILDLGLPDMEGEAVIETLRGFTAAPIIVLSVRDAESGKVRVLDLGADDYVVKPFGVDELLARLRAAMRHRLQQGGQAPLIAFGAVEVDLLHRRVRRDGAAVRLSKKEFDLLRFLIDHVDKVLTHRQLLQAVWGQAHQDDVEYLRVYMRQLRAKLERDPQRPTHLLTETGVGYRLTLEG